MASLVVTFEDKSKMKKFKLYSDGIEELIGEIHGQRIQAAVSKSKLAKNFVAITVADAIEKMAAGGISAEHEALVERIVRRVLDEMSFADLLGKVEQIMDKYVDEKLDERINKAMARHALGRAKSSVG